MGSKDAPEKMQFLGSIKKVASLNPWRQNAKWRKPPTDLTVTESKYARIPIFLHIPRAHEQINIHIWVYGKNMPWEKVPVFLKSHQCRKKK